MCNQTIVINIVLFNYIWYLFDFISLLKISYEYLKIELEAFTLDKVMLEQMWRLIKR